MTNKGKTFKCGNCQKSATILDDDSSYICPHCQTKNNLPKDDDNGWWGIVIIVLIIYGIYSYFDKPSDFKFGGRVIGCMFNPKELRGQDMFTTIDVEFNGTSTTGRVEFRETNINNYSLISCSTDGSYKYSEETGELVIDGINNSNCPWMSIFNGNYQYTKEKGDNGDYIYIFKSNNIDLLISK